MLIDKSKFEKNCLANKTVLITGGGGGIGFEAARSLVRLGANVIIAEIDEEKGSAAQEKIRKELKTDQVVFYCIDISNNNEIEELYKFIKNKYKFLDILINNATIIPIGSIENISLDEWDKSYNVNLKAPINLTKKFLPDMKEANMGTIVYISSSGAAPYMGAYEIFKSSQVELCNTLYGEIQDYNINTFVIGPGLVKTESAIRSIDKVAKFMRIKPLQIYELNKEHMLDVESAGAGFAAAVVLATKYNGQEIGSMQALIDAGIIKDNDIEFHNTIPESAQEILNTLIPKIVNTYCEQYIGWTKRNIFERQWVLRDFKKCVGYSASQFKDIMIEISRLNDSSDYKKIITCKSDFIKLKEYYMHQHKLLQGYEKNPKKLKENSLALSNWINELKTIIDNL